VVPQKEHQELLHKFKALVITEDETYAKLRATEKRVKTVKG